MDVTANQEEISDYETFQFEYDSTAAKWTIRTMQVSVSFPAVQFFIFFPSSTLSDFPLPQDKYFSGAGGVLQAGESQRASAALFDLVWLEDGAVALKAENGKFVGTKKSGQLFANVGKVEEQSKYYLYLTNRPQLVLKCDQGFVGYRAVSGNLRLECNKTSYAITQVERAQQGQVNFRGQNGKYWQVADGGIVCDSEIPQGFYLELREPTRMCIKTVAGQYVVEQKNGGFAVGGLDPELATR